MQLCTNARLFLDLVAAAGQPKLWELAPPEARSKVLELTRMVECEEPIGKIENHICQDQWDHFGSAFTRRCLPTTGRQEASSFSRWRVGIG
jgi:hypothetical protein